jgi:hypothetical protein
MHHPAYGLRSIRYLRTQRNKGKEEGQVWHPGPECRFSPLLVDVLLY